MSEVYDCSQPDSRRAGLTRACSALRSGGIVVLPTDTSYGIGCDAFNAVSASRVRNLKGMSENAPLSVLVGSWHTIDGLSLGVATSVRELIEAFWPGGLSLIVPHAPSLAWNIGDTGGTVVIRMPLHPVTLELLKEVGPMIVSAANRTGDTEARDVATTQGYYGEDIAVYLDGGILRGQGRSTIVDATGPQLILVREGIVPISAIRSVAGRNLIATPQEQ